MARENDAVRLPVLLIYDLDPMWTSSEQDSALRENHRLGFAMRRRGHSVRFLAVRGPGLEDSLSEYDPGKVLVFNWCESLPGVRCSEPLVAEVLERMGFTYTGSPPDTLALSYDKPRVKSMLESEGIAIPRWALLDGGRAIREWDRFPAIVKPANEHCSIGVDPQAVVLARRDLETRVAYLTRRLGQPAIVEEFIDGREFHVPLWGNRTVEVLPPVEMDFSAFDDLRDRICSYESKFVPDSDAYRKTKSIARPSLTESETYALEVACKTAYRALGCRDYARIDVRLLDGVFYVLDVNPNADLSADASVALAANKAGYTYGAMGSRLLSLAARRHPQAPIPNQCPQRSAVN